jgi:hypothetical protein
MRSGPRDLVRHSHEIVYKPEVKTLLTVSLCSATVGCAMPALPVNRRASVRLVLRSTAL